MHRTEQAEGEILNSNLQYSLRLQVGTAEQNAATPQPQVYNGAQYQQYQADAWAAYYQQQQQAAAWHQYGETTPIGMTQASAASLVHCHCPRLAVKILGCWLHTWVAVMKCLCLLFLG